MIEFTNGAAKVANQQNFSYLYLLVRGITNVMILEADQKKLLNTLKEKKIIRKILEIMNQVDNELFKDLQIAQYFCLFITHSLRLFILCLSIDQNALEQESDETQPSLRQILRKYQLYEKAFPQNAALMNALKGDMHWFRHAPKGCHLTSIYIKQVEEVTQAVTVCGNCGKKKSDLKVCSRCMKVFYCDRDCQKAHFTNHKSICVPK